METNITNNGCNTDQVMSAGLVGFPSPLFITLKTQNSWISSLNTPSLGQPFPTGAVSVISIDSKCNLHQFAWNWVKCGTDPASEWGHFWFMQQLQERLEFPTFLQQRWSLTAQGCSAALEPAATGGKTAACKGKCTAGEAGCGDSSLPSAGETEQHKEEYKKKQCC